MAEDYQIYLVRHAIAAERGEQYPDDAKRPLTERGIDKFRKVVRGLEALDVRADVILTSPFVRARQTADVLAQRLPGHPPIIETRALVPGAPFTELQAALEKHARKSSIVLVGHEPGIGELAARLIGARAALAFRKGAVCRIDVDSLPPTAPGHLVWFAPPKILGRLGD